MQKKLKKLIPYCLVLIILVGLFSPIAQIYAQREPDPNVDCTQYTTGTQAFVDCMTAIRNGTTTSNPAAAADASKPGISDKLPECGILAAASLTGCLVQTAYYLFFALPAAILRLTASLFDAMLTITLSTILYNNNFLPEAWRIVRDFSNIFFILILLYIAIKMILGLGGAEIKKMIAQVIIVALLINFSMFFTQVVIDSSNILALIFYNKISLNVTKDGKSITPTPILDQSQTKVEEKDFSVGIVAAFDPSTRIPPDAWKAPTKISFYQALVATGGDGPATALVYVLSGQDFNTSLYLEVIFVSGAIFLFAAYAFLVAALAFIGRLIELWMCIIFAPFAFLSLTVPKLAGTEYFGWKAWSERLISVAFMAPIFMFFMYLISKLIQARIFDKLTSATQGTGLILLLVIIPAIINLTLLMKAVHYAKKGAGQFGEAAVKYGGMVAGLAGGLALGAASGGATLAIGAGGGTVLNTLGKKAGNNFVGNKLRDAGGFLQSRSFDIRNIKPIGKLTSKAGLGEGRKGSFKETKEKQKERHEKRAAELEKRWTGGERKEVENAKANMATAKTELETSREAKDLANAKEGLKLAELPVKAELENLEKVISKFEKDFDKASKTYANVKGTGGKAEADAEANFKAASGQLDFYKKRKADIRTSAGLEGHERGVLAAQTNYNKEEVRVLSAAEKRLVDAQRAFDRKSGAVVRQYADQISSTPNKTWNRIKSFGLYSGVQADETARKIRQNAKTESASGKMSSPPLTI